MVPAVSLVTILRSALSYVRILSCSLLPIPEGYRLWTSVTDDLTGIRAGRAVFRTINCCHEVLNDFVKLPALIKVQNAAIARN